MEPPTHAINVTNKTALYNFLSTFSGTHYVTPRAMTAELGFIFSSQNQWLVQKSVGRLD